MKDSLSVSDNGTFYFLHPPVNDDLTTIANFLLFSVFPRNFHKFDPHSPHIFNLPVFVVIHATHIEKYSSFFARSESLIFLK